MAGDVHPANFGAFIMEEKPMENVIAYSIRCTRLDTKKVILTGNILAMPWITIEGFSEYWLNSFGKEVERLSEGNSCEVVINNSNGETKSFTRVVNAKTSFADSPQVASEPEPQIMPGNDVEEPKPESSDLNNESENLKNEIVEEKKIEKPKKKKKKHVQTILEKHEMSGIDNVGIKRILKLFDKETGRI